MIAAYVHEEPRAGEDCLLADSPTEAEGDLEEVHLFGCLNLPSYGTMKSNDELTSCERNDSADATHNDMIV